MDNEAISEMFNKNLSVAEATSYSKELQKTYMARTTTFDRDAIQKYVSVFLKTLKNIRISSIHLKVEQQRKRLMRCF